MLQLIAIKYFYFVVSINVLYQQYILSFYIHSKYSLLSIFYNVIDIVADKTSLVLVQILLKEFVGLVEHVRRISDFISL